MYYVSRGFDGNSILELKKQYAEYYVESFINKNDVGRIVSLDDNDNEIEFSDEEVISFINDVNDMIDEAR